MANKVSKEAGKSLSSNDYTTTEKSKLSGIATGATKITVNDTLTSTSTTEALSAAQGKTLNDNKMSVGSITKTSLPVSSGLSASVSYYAKTQYNLLLLNGVIIGSMKHNEIIVTLPSGYRPSGTREVPAAYMSANYSACTLSIRSNGSIYLYMGSGTADFVYINTVLSI